ncbi:MAG: thioredoxin family protein [Bacteroidetes bacterium]|nr:thioredoxin family protein [Bacteroidota bacterium]
MSLELLFFSAGWCEPCKWAEPIVNEVIENAAGKISLNKIDIDANAAMAKQHHIMSVPTLVLFKEGKEVWRMKGFDTASNLQKIFANII